MFVVDPKYKINIFLIILTMTLIPRISFTNVIIIDVDFEHENIQSKVIISEGEDGIRKYGTQRFDLIFMDIEMPIMNGTEAMINLRLNHSALPPIICLTANSMEGDAEKYKNQGFDNYLSKPVRIDDIKNIILTNLQHIKSFNQNEESKAS